ncbi:MlaC/ttg2D family ABC transporter substrate-binding protein [Ferrimonas senticii]|uniref:MlaC/ttg2D family ABC transporter substrate-binding protein n=1 Tax=Ferrimonas senticii TaxID=394566 RepID=UPI0004145740|nr:ABC transporter substrate-binding protein [Ferrimonas senticii]
MKKLMMAAVALCGSWLAPAYAEVDQSNPYTMVEQVASELLGNYSERRAELDANPQLLRQLIETDLMPYVNVKYASYKVMGKAVRSATPEQRDNFTAEFREYMVTTFAQAFTVYTDQTIEFEPAQPLTDRNIVSVGVTFIEGTRPPIEVKLKLRLNKKSGDWQAIDLIAEGASILAAKETEFGGLIRQQGLDAVIQMLNDNNQKALAGQS